jgi:hypothetical protein
VTRFRGMTRRRRVLAAALVAAVIAGAVVGVVASRGGAAALPNSLRRAKDVDAVVVQVQLSFGDRRIISASVEGSLLIVTLSVPHPSDVGAADTYENKAVFEAQVLGHAVADWQRAHGQQPITTVRYRDTNGRSLLGWSLNGDPIESDPNVSPLAPGTCDSAATAAAAGETSLALVSAKTLPWINGTCVFAFQTADPAAGSAAAADMLQRIILSIGHPPNVRPWFFELDAKGSNSGLTNAGWMPDGDGFTAAEPGLTYPLAHG